MFELRYNSICNIANAIVSQFKQIGTLTKTGVENRIPTVFVKKGYYKNGQLHLTIINKSRAFNLIFQANKKTTELAVSDYVSQSVNLTGSYEQNVQLNLGGLFDIGISILGDKSKQLDALYLADGPWGLDYLDTETAISSFKIEKTSNDVIPEGQYAVERNATVTGKVYGTMNLFRNILPGELVFDAKSFSTIGFAIQNSLPVEVVLVTENTSDWNNRLRLKLPINATAKEINIALEKFSNGQGQKYNNEKIKGLVFSVQGNYQTFQSFEVAISQLTFKNANPLVIPTVDQVATTKLYNYPNPCTNATTLVLPEQVQNANIKVMDVLGRTVKAMDYKAIASSNEIAVGLDNLARGVYFFVVTSEGNKQFKTKFVVQ